MSRAYLPGDSRKTTNILKSTHFLQDEELKVVLIYLGTTQNTAVEIT
jgi:hypothetical protein